ncbi:MAG: hypothetical protein U0640_01620 [Phycisphaerales bacterium]
MPRRAYSLIRLIVSILTLIVILAVVGWLFSGYMVWSMIPKTPAGPGVPAPAATTAPASQPTATPQPQTAAKQASDSEKARIDAEIARQREEREAKKAQAEQLAKKLDAIIQEEKTSLLEMCKAIVPKARELSVLVTNPPEHSKAALDERRSAAVSLQTDVDALLNRMSTYSDILKAKLTEAGASQADISGLLVDARLGASLGIRQAGAETVADVCDYVIKECDLLSGSMSAWRVKDGKIEADDLSVAGRLAGPRVHLEGKLAVLDTMLRQLAQ